MSPLLSSTIQLQREIQMCINALIFSRMRQDKQKEREHLSRMESLMCATMQQFQCIIDKLTEDENTNS